ncbi:unnamed protein product [Durusdinium trenchii]|uniref:Uncharacterized protein n=1 Tax=Durusdinium trenchii TaxID=1381693 RepID=A0ABP0MSA3_9DINO
MVQMLPFSRNGQSPLAPQHTNLSLVPPTSLEKVVRKLFSIEAWGGQCFASTWRTRSSSNFAWKAPSFVSSSGSYFTVESTKADPEPPLANLLNQLNGVAVDATQTSSHAGRAWRCAQKECTRSCAGVAGQPIGGVAPCSPQGQPLEARRAR